MNETLNFEDLKKITGYTRQGDVERCLKDQGIKVFWGKSGPWTTLHHLNHPYGQAPVVKTHEPITF